MSRLLDKVAVVSGAARGQGRAHAVAMAREGAHVVAFDACVDFASTRHPGSTLADLEETARLVEKEGRTCLAAQVDARDLSALRELASRTMSELGRVDILVVNHGIWSIGDNSWSFTEEMWQESIDVLLTGAWKVTTAFVPAILEGERGGSVIMTSSAMGLKPQPSSVAYTAAKHGVLGVMRTLAWELGEHSVRVNAIMPGSVATPMTQEGDTVETSIAAWPRFFGTDRSLLPVAWMPPEVIADAAVFLASDESRFITGVALPVDAGWTNF